MLCSFAVATAEFVLVGLLPEIAADLTVSVSAAGQLVTVYMLVVTVGGPVATVLTRRLPRRSLLAATMALATGRRRCPRRRTPTACCSSPGSARRSRRRCSWPSPRRSRWPRARRAADRGRRAGVRGLRPRHGDRAAGRLARRPGLRVARRVRPRRGAGRGRARRRPRLLPAHPGARTGDTDSFGGVVRVVANRSVLTGLAVTLLTLTGFVAVFTYVAPMLSTVAGLSPGGSASRWSGTAWARSRATCSPDGCRPRPSRGCCPCRSRCWPSSCGQGVLLPNRAAALVGLVVLGVATFVVVPLLQTWLMTRVGQAEAGLIAAVNISVAGIAGALGAGLGGAVLAVGLGLVAIGPIAAVPVLGGSLRRSPSADGPPGAVPGLRSGGTNVDRSTERGARTHDHATRRAGDGTGHTPHEFDQPPEVDGDFLDEEWLEPRATSSVTKVLSGWCSSRSGSWRASRWAAARPTRRGRPGAGEARRTRAAGWRRWRRPGRARHPERRRSGGSGGGTGVRGAAHRRGHPEWAGRAGVGEPIDRAGPSDDAPAARDGGPSAAATPANAARPTPAAAPAAAGGGGGRSGRRRRH